MALSCPAPGSRPGARRRALFALALALCGCTSRVVPRTPDGGGAVDGGATDGAGPPDLGPRAPWRSVSPAPADSDLRAVFGLSSSDYYLLTAEALLRRTGQEQRVLYRAAAPACLRGLLAVGDDVLAAGGCGSVGLLLRKSGAQELSVRELPNLALAGLWARGVDEIFIASPSAGVLRLAGAELTLERTVAQGELGSGPLALWGQGADVFAVGNGRVLHRKGGGLWEVERSAPSEQQLGIWGSGPGDIYVVGATERGGAIWHRSGVGAPFKAETMLGPTPGAITAVWGNGKDEVYAAAERGAVLRRDPATGAWAADRLGDVDQPLLRSLWGAGPGHLLAAGPGGLLERRGGAFEPVLGQALTGAALRAVALSAPDEGLVVGDAGVVLRLSGGRFSREARGLTGEALYGAAIAPDGTAYAVGGAGVALRRDRAGVWTLERALPDGATAALRAVAAGQGGQLIAVGEQGRVASREGGLWQAEPDIETAAGPLRSTLRAVALLPDGTAVAVGDDNTVLWRPPGSRRFSAFSPEPSAPRSYSGLWAVGSELWASASGSATLLRWSAGQLTLEAAPLSDASAVWGTGPQDLYLGGRDGSLWHNDGWGWRREPAPLGEAIFALGGSGATVIAAGEHGYLLQRP